MIFNRIITDAQDQNWVAAIVDMLIVVIGLFTGLQVDAWWQSYQESSQERIYLMELNEDFRGNQDLLQGALDEGARILNDMVVLSNQSLLPTPELSAQELDEKFSSLQSMHSFIPISSAYDNLVSSSELGIISNRDIKNTLADYYSFADLAELIQSTHEMQLVEVYQPYMRDNTELARVMISWQEAGDFSLPEPAPQSGILEIIGSRQFRNIITDKYYSAIDLRSIHIELQDINSELLQLIESELSEN